jgi:hypothetical protein
MSDKKPSDFTERLQLAEIIGRPNSTSLEEQVQIQVAKTIEAMIPSLLNNEQLKAQVKYLYERILSAPHQIDENIRLMLQYEITEAIKQTINNLSSIKGIQMNEIFAIAVPIVTSATMQALLNGSVIKSLSESLEELKEQLNSLSPIPNYDAQYLKENLSTFIKEAHERDLSFSMMAVKLQEKSPKLSLSDNNRLVSFMEMVLKKKGSPASNFEIVSMENGYYILLFINTTTRTACVCAWALDEEIKRSFDQEFSVALASYDPLVLKKIRPEQHQLMQVHKQLPSLYGLSLLKMLEIGIELGRTLPKDKPGIIFQLKKILSPQVFERDGLQYILENGDRNFTGILASLFNPQARQVQAQPRVLEPPSSSVRKASTLRTVHFPEDNCSVETEPIVERREIAFKGIKSDK